MGSACLFFHIQPHNALLSDINPHLVNTFKAVRKNPEAVSERLKKIPKGKRSYYAIRSIPFESLKQYDAAANFIFLNRFCFNGLYRTNRLGGFNVPYASSGTGMLTSPEELLDVAAKLKDCEILCADFESVVSRANSDDFVYLDPPYAVENRRVFRQYGPSSFGLNDLQRLAESLDLMDKRGCKFLMSYALCPEVRQYFGKWPMRRYYIQRNIAGFATHRRRAAEILISNCFPD